MSTSSLRLCVWRCRATELGYSPRWTMGAASSWEKCRTRRRRIVWARRGKVVIVIVTWAVPFLPLSLPFCTSIALFFAITPSRSLSFSLFLSLSRSSATCHKMVAWERCLLILGLGLFFFFTAALLLLLVVFCRSICFHLKLIWLHLRIPKVFCQQQFRPDSGGSLAQGTHCTHMCDCLRSIAENCCKRPDCECLQMCVRVCVCGPWLGISAAQKTLHFGIDFAYT